MYIYTYICRERETERKKVRERDREKEGGRALLHTSSWTHPSFTRWAAGTNWSISVQIRQLCYKSVNFAKNPSTLVRTSARARHNCKTKPDLHYSEAGDPGYSEASDLEYSDSN